MMKAKKLSFEEFKELYTPFYINEEYEEKTESEINTIIDSLYQKMKDIGTKDGLFNYIISDSESLANILSLLNFSAEKFKRIVTMLRMEIDTSFRTEWDLGRIRNEIIHDPVLRDKVLTLLLEGANDPEFSKKIPKFYLDNLVLDDLALTQLQDKFQLKKLVKSKRDGRYNNNVGDNIENIIENKLKEIMDKYGVTYDREKFVPWISRNMDFSIPSKEDPYVIIEVSYQVTTGSSQTTKRNEMVKTSQDVRSHNIQNGKNVAFINFIEGLGWIARQSDMKRIYDCSDYVLNLKTLDMLESIILEHVPKKYFK